MEALAVIYKMVGGWRGCIGIVGILALSVMLAIRTGEAHHWKKQFGIEQQAFATEHAAFTQTVANYRAAALQARIADAANSARVTGKYSVINKDRTDALTSRLADARALDQRLRSNAKGPANLGGGRAAPVSGLSDPGPALTQASGQDGLPHSDALIATEQAIQLDELIKAVHQLERVDVNGQNAPLAAPAEAHGGKEARDLKR
jgi:hypothetical protein